MSLFFPLLGYAFFYWAVAFAALEVSNVVVLLLIRDKSERLATRAEYFSTEDQLILVRGTMWGGLAAGFVVVLSLSIWAVVAIMCVGAVFLVARAITDGVVEALTKKRPEKTTKA